MGNNVFPDLHIFLEICLAVTLSVVIHELVHYIIVMLSGYPYKFDFEDWSPTIHFSDELSKSTQIYIYLSAIASGLIVIILFVIFSPNRIIHIISFVVYIWGCYHDIHKLFDLMSNNTNQ
jgi:hypothetical protein